MKLNKHVLSYRRLFTGDMGQLYPIGLTEVLPSDVFQHHTDLLIRLSPMVAPVLHSMTVRVHHFFVPHRLTWSGFEDFITGGEDGLDATTVPTVATTGTSNDLLDYFGIPRVSGVDVSALPIRAFNLVFNEFYRDQDLVAERTEDQLDVPNVAWEKDYFTTARPWAQKGEEVTLPLGDEAPVRSNAFITNSGYSSPSLGNGYPPVDDSASGGDPGYLWESGNRRVVADLSAASSATVTDLRRAFALQRFAEARARYGSRYSEYLKYAFGARNLDARLGRPEYLGGGKANLNVSEVLQTAPEAGGTSSEYGVGDLYGHGMGALRTNKYRRQFDEHGYVISLLSVRPKAVYQNGIDRTWLRQDREDFFVKELQHIGQQEIKLNELYADATNGDNTFGYQDRYREYREQQSRVSNNFRDTLNYWHLARNLSSAPTLNESFIECNPSKRVFNVQSEHTMWCAARHSLVARRVVDKSALAKII
jgi:hypothetical protein